jgi:tetratricopeptide (TPR) repeat protein
MCLRLSTYLSFVSLFAVALCAPTRSFSQQPTPDFALGGKGLPGTTGLNGVIATSNLDVFIKEPSGEPFRGTAVVTLTKLDGQVYRQSTAQVGYFRFSDVAPTEYTIQVVATAYERAVKRLDAQGNSLMSVTIVLSPAAGLDARTAADLAALNPKAQKEIAKAMDALRAQKPEAARGHLETLERIAPNHAEVSYLFGVYSSQVNDWAKAKTYWTQTLALNPRHVRALLSMGEMSIREKKAAEGMEYAKRAVEADSASWRAHAILSEASLLQGLRDESVKEAERALDLGHGEAAEMQPFLARALAERGDKERAIALLEAYVHDHPADVTAKKDLDTLHAPPAPSASSVPATTAESLKAAALNEVVVATMGRSTWMPPDVDASIPPVEPGASCTLDEVMQKAATRMEELVHNIDRFTATELILNETINKKGFAAGPEKATFNYLVSIEVLGGGFLNVDEFRQRKSSSPGFPESVMTNGLPAMVLIFHPRFARNYQMACEGLAQSNAGLAWQVHFRQREDQPNELRSYRLGAQGPSYPVAVKGRAWIAADSYEIVRMETDLVAPLPDIRLAADHVAVEYGPVHFRSGAREMWLPQSAEVFFEWRGQRVHRRHKFSNYLLFSVDDKQKISAPRAADAPLSPESEKPN